MHSNTLSGKNCQQNTAANPNDVRNIMPVLEREGEYSESLGK